MTATDYDLATIAAGPNDLIRIVPLHGAEQQAVAGAPAPRLTYRGGPLLAAVKVFTLFWGAAWDTSPQDALATGLNAFFDDILTSALIDQLAEYSVPGSSIGHGQRVGTTVVTRPRPHSTVSDTTIRHMLQHQIASNAAVPKPDAQTLYFVYLPPGTTVTQGGSRSCQAFCGYHDQIQGQVFYAVMPYPGCSGCTGGLTPLDALTSTSSHELCEAITDAIPGQGWYDDAHGEIGDICAWQTKVVGGHTVQLEWSNQGGACV